MNSNITPDKKKALFYAKRDIAQIVTDVMNLPIFKDYLC